MSDRGDSNKPAPKPLPTIPRAEVVKTLFREAEQKPVPRPAPPKKAED